MKKLFRTVYVVLKGFGYARLAGEYSRAGNHKKAIEVMQEYNKCK